MLRLKQNWYCVGKWRFPRMPSYELDSWWWNPLVPFCSLILTPVSTHSHLGSAGPCTVEQIASVLINCCNSQCASLSISGTHQERRFSQRFRLPFYVKLGLTSQESKVCSIRCISKCNTSCTDLVSVFSWSDVTACHTINQSMFSLLTFRCNNNNHG